MHWLIAEDEADIRNLVSMMCTVWGHTATALESGHEAWTLLDQIEAGEYEGQLPDFALMDIRMPGHRGDEIAKRIRSTDGIDHIPIVLMTAFVLNEEERRAMMQEAGVDRIIYKPLPDFEDLRVELHDVIDRRQRAN